MPEAPSVTVRKPVASSADRVSGPLDREAVPCAGAV